MKIYVIGSLRNPKVPLFANKLRGYGHEVFDDWYAAGPEADDRWKDYEQGRGHSYAAALHGNAAGHVFEYDRKWLDWADGAALLLPAGRSGHLELGYIIGQGKPGYILLPEDHDRWDVMYRFAKGVYDNEENLIAALQRDELGRLDAINSTYKARYSLSEKTLESIPPYEFYMDTAFKRDHLPEGSH